jgi:hypothetical protein
MAPDAGADSRLSGHRRVLGLCWIVYGILRLAMAVWLVLFSGTATVMFGALLVRVGDPFTLMSIFHFVYVGIVVLSVLCGILGLLAGMALLSSSGAGRKLALAAGFFSVSEIPFGTTLGIYTLVVFLP